MQFFFFLTASDPQNCGATFPMECPLKIFMTFLQEQCQVILERSHIKSKTKQLLLEP